MIDLLVLSDGTKLYKMRNPHGEEKYKGPWSDTDTTNWTPARMKEVKKVHTVDDGVFYMDPDSYLRNFMGTTVNYSIENK